MFKKIFQYLRYYDWIMFSAMLLLVGFSIAALYGIANGSDQPNYSTFYRQIFFILIGLGVYFVMSMMDFHFFRAYAYVSYGIMLLLLVGVLFFGQTLRGTTGWLSLFGFAFQPVELAKLILLIVLAKIFSEYGKQAKDFMFLLKTGVVTVGYFALVLLQPDFGSAMLLFFTWFGLLLLSGIPRVYIISIMGSLLLLFLVGWFFLFQTYQKDRIATFFQPMADPLGSGYHVRQSIIAIGSGNLFGKGLASGSQSQLKFIPASQTDFIFAVISEELGFIGSTVVLILYAIFFYRLLRIAQRTHDEYALYFISGTVILFFTQCMINIGMNLGIMPVTGISLPFLSYGGSFLVIAFALAGISQSIYIRSITFKV